MSLISASRVSLLSRRFSKKEARLPTVPSKEEPYSVRFRKEGDKLFEKRQYELAIVKYEQAHRLDPEDVSIILHLAECYYKLQRWQSLIETSNKVLQIDKVNARAWGYVAEAYAVLEQWISSFEAYDTALDILKSQNPPDDQLRGELLQSYEEAKGKAKLRRANSSKKTVQTADGRQPWDLATTAAPSSGLDSPPDTSGVVIREAHLEYAKGYHLLMTKCKETILPNGETGITADPQTIAYITNGIVRDERCFYMVSESAFVKQLAGQAQYEILRTNAWDLSASESTITTEALERQRVQGWDDVRPALSTTVRICILNAHLSQGLGQYGQAVGLYRRALAVLDWGRKVWAKASRKERGAIFDSTFVRGVRVLHCTTLVRAYMQTQNEKSHPYSLREIYEISTRIIEDCRDRPVKSVLSSGKPASRVFVLSYQKYPEGRARMCSAFYWHQLGKEKILNGEDRAEANRDLRLSANEHLNAKELFPQDDEYYSICLETALEVLFLAKTPLRETSAIITQLRTSWAASQRIWVNSSYATSGGKEKMDRLFQFQDNALRAVEEKAGAIGDRIVPGRLGDRVL